MRSSSERLRFTLAATALLAVLLAVPHIAAAADADCDGVEDSVDNCPERFNPTQSDLDGDLIGDRCDPDKDDDLVVNKEDNCPKVANAGQEDADGDLVGDACDQCAEETTEVVGNRGCSIDQLCPCDGPDDDEQWRSHDQYVRCIRKKSRSFRNKGLITGDERGEIVESAIESTCGTPVPAEGDNDGDGVADGDDNCPSDSNPSQKNTDADEFGDACDTDKDGDGVLNPDDNCPVVSNASGQGDDADEDLVGDACDACPESEFKHAVDADGCSLDQHCPCEAEADGDPWGGHKKYVHCYVDEVFRFELLGEFSHRRAEVLKDKARRSDCGELPEVCE